MRRPVFALFLAAALTVLLWIVPFGTVLARPLVWLSTLAHEAGHGLAAVLVGGTFDRLQLFVDGSGVASSRFAPSASAWVSLGGLVGPAVAAFALFMLGILRRPARVVLALLGLACLVLTAWVAAGVFSHVCLVGLGLSLLLAAWRMSAPAAQVTLLFLAVQLSLSVFSRADYLFASTAKTGAGEMPSDVAQVASQWGGAIPLWGLLIGGFSIAVLVAGLLVFAFADRLAAWRDRVRLAHAKGA